MRIPVAVTLESRDGTVSKDAKVLNGVVEPKGDQAILRKRPGLADLAQIWTATGTAQLLYPWNGLWAIFGDYLSFGTPTSMASPATTTWSTTDKGSNVSLSGSNLTATFAAAANIMVRATESRSSGKFYWEVTIGTGAANAPIIGIAKSGATLNGYLGSDGNGWGYQANGNKAHSGSGVAYGATFTTNDVIGVALDLTAGTLTFYKNGVSQGVAYSGLSGTFFPAASGDGVSIEAVTANFGASAFSGTVPTGYTSGLGLVLAPTTAGLRFDAQEVGSSASTQLMMIKNRTQAWTVNRAGTFTAVSLPSGMGAVTYAVSSLTRSSTTATATLASDPVINIGDSITVAGANQAAYNVTANVTAVSPATAATVIPLSITRTGTTATATSAIPHGLTTGTYTLSGASQSEYNGSKSITVTSTTTFTFTVTVTPEAPATPATGSPVLSNQSWNVTGQLAANGTTTLTYTTSASASHDFVVGDVIVISGALVVGGVPDLNGSHTVTSVPSATRFTFEVPSWPAGQLYSDPSVTASITHTAPAISSITRSNNLATITTASPHNFSANHLVTVSGCTQPQYNLIFSPISASGSTITYIVSYTVEQPASPATGSPAVTRPGASATVSYTVAGSPTTPATGTITLTTNGGMVPGIPYIDGYFFLMDNNGVMWASALDDPTSWPALNFLTAQNENGRGKALAKSLNNLVAFKEWSTEFFFDAKNQTGFPFSPVDNGFTQVGCASGDSIAKIDGDLVWLSQVRERGRSVHVMNGLQQQKVSTPDVERILNLDDLATVYAFGVKLGGHSLYVLTLVTSNITLVYDLTAQAWTQWSSLVAGSPLTISSITRSGTTITVTTSIAHGLSAGDPVTISGVDQGQYNGSFLVTTVVPNGGSPSVSFTYEAPDVGGSADPTGTVTATAYTSSYFKFTKYCDYQGANLFLHETNGHLYQMLPTLYQDAGAPIDLFVRTTRLDGGAIQNKVMGSLVVVGDAISDSLILRWSNDDCQTFSAYRSVSLSYERPMLRRCGKFRRRTIELRHVGNTSPRIEALELEVS